MLIGLCPEVLSSPEESNKLGDLGAAAAGRFLAGGAGLAAGRFSFGPIAPVSGDRGNFRWAKNP